MLTQCLWESNLGQTQTCLCARGPSSRLRAYFFSDLCPGPRGRSSSTEAGLGMPRVRFP